MIEAKGSDRRVHERYEFNNSAFVTFRPKFEIIGMLKDISAGGVSFEYSLLHKTSEPFKADWTTVDIFRHPNSFDLAQVPCEVVYDVSLEERPSFLGLESRRCGLRFGNLTSSHKNQINTLLSLVQPNPDGKTVYQN